MASRWFSADFHLGMKSIIALEGRPFASVDQMNASLISSCAAAGEDDVILHLGDLASYGCDRHCGEDSADGLSVKPADMVKNIRASFVNIRGNHDACNRVKSLANSLQTSLGRRFPQVICGHYPTYDRHARDYVKRGWITLCGHVHGKWKHCLDLDSQCLNVNVGVDAWNYKIVSEDQIIRYIEKLLSYKPYNLYRCRTVGGKTVFSENGPDGKETTT